MTRSLLEKFEDHQDRMNEWIYDWQGGLPLVLGIVMLLLVLSLVMNS